MSYRLGIDVGGTFTDLLLFNEKSGALTLTKVASTPQDQSIGVINGIHKIAGLAGIAPNDIQLILHGTTVATNAVLEGKGAKVGLLTTKGFEQILHVARSQTPGPLAGWIIMIKPDPMAPLEYTRGVSARMSAKGAEMSPLDEAEVRQHIKDLHHAGIEALTVALINSFANAAHEQAIKVIAQELYPDLPVTISTDILPEFREYERCLTTVMNSYVQPKMRVYLNGMKEKLAAAQITSPMNIVRSDGGVMSLDAAQERPVNTLLSGPSGGAVAAAYIGELTGYRNVLSFDMGGTSTDVAIALDAKPNVLRDTRVGMYPVKAPSVDVRTVGAGGGSIAHVPAVTGALRVGPQSAGAVPGPAAYNTGGTEPTVTDANIVLGYLPPMLLGGEMSLDTAAAEQAVQKIADALKLDLHQAAEGIYNIVNENMFGALRLVSVERGYDPRNFALVALGGAGPLHANALSILSGTWPSIIPPTPGVLSALGFLHSDIKNEFSRTVIRTTDKIDRREINAILTGLGEQAREWLNHENIPAKNQRINYQIDLRYYRQGYEFPIDIELKSLDSEQGFQTILDDFQAAHEKNYGFRTDHLIEVVNLRAIGIGIVAKLELSKAKPATGPNAPHAKDASKAVLGTHKVYCKGKFVNAPIYDRYALKPGNHIGGPAVITQKDTTTLILPKHYGRVDAYQNILIFPDGYETKATKAKPNGKATAKAKPDARSGKAKTAKAHR
ncbi:MAG: hydantoinase/oxoprolinase family protein [Acidobacteria bacterium]|nr:hydantoinase/oxoprolinase family protein [Acidobacteriota bacterium]